VHDVCAQKTAVNVFYDPTRELYQEFNAAFAKQWKAKTSETVPIKQGSRELRQPKTRAVNDGHVFISWESERYRARTEKR
jgi:sulfate transport system substrate-binding protein